MSKINISAVFQEHQQVITQLEKFIPDIEIIAEKMINALNNSGTIFWIGNGGSAADAQHMAAELIGRYKKERKSLASIALTTDSSILTSISNDYHFDKIFSRQIEGLCKSQDIIIGLSTSGNSENIIQAIKAAKKIGAYTIILTGHEGGKLKSLGDISLIMPSQTTARIQEAHSLICHILCEMIDEYYAGD